MRCFPAALIGVALTASALGWGASVFAQGGRHVKSSMLLLIDASGSMGDPIGSGNPQVKIEAAKQAAIAALGRAAKSGSVEVAVLAFSGDCQNPVPRYQDFTRDVGRLTQFIGSLQPGGGTPMAEALLFANRYMHTNGDSKAATRMIMLLADGQNDCGDIGQAMATLQSSGIVFRHETVGFGITPSSAAAQDLRQIATQTGGVYHHAADANQLADVFMEFVDTFTLIDMLGMIVRLGTPGKAAKRQGQPKAKQASGTAALPPKPASGQVTGMLGMFKSKKPTAKTDDPIPAASGSVLCYKQFSNPLGLSGVREGYQVSEFTCAPACEEFGGGEAKFDRTYMRAFENLDPQTMTCGERCAYAAGSSSGATRVWGHSNDENHCVHAFDPLQPPHAVTHDYCDYSDNKHRVTWQSGSRQTTAFRIYLNHYPDRNHEAKFMGATRGETFEFEYGINYHEDPLVDGLNRWNPFPQVGVSACNKYSICSPVVYGRLGDCGP